MCAALVAERTEAPAPGRVSQTGPLRVEGLNHYYGEGEGRNQVLVNKSHRNPGGTARRDDRAVGGGQDNAVEFDWSIALSPGGQDRSARPRRVAGERRWI